MNPSQLRAIATTSLLAASLCSSPLHAADSQWVYPGPQGQLLYKSQPNGDRIVDYSDVGYLYGREPLPEVQAVITVSPGPGDDTQRIQDAIDFVSSQPRGADGYRGAVQLAEGEFQIDSSVWIQTSGVVLRGAGESSSGGTVLRGTGTTSRDLIMVQGAGSWARVANSTRSVIDKVVPVGATSFRVNDAASFSVGDRVIVERPSTQNWIEDMGMDQIPPRPDGGEIVQWAEGSYNRRHDRTITRIEGDRIFLDAPLTQSLEEKYGGGTVYKYSWDGRISHVGVENLRGISDYDTNNTRDEAHARSLIFMDKLEHGFVQNVTAEHFWYSLVELEVRSKNVTVQNATNLDPISIVTGGRRYAFQNNSQLSLLRDLYSENGRHDFVRNSPNTGPNVFLDAVAVNALNDTGPHQRWSTGGLYDNVTIQGDEINIRNRGYYGTGHGWTAGNSVVWNSLATGFIIQNPPTAQNWLIGSIGLVKSDDTFGEQEPGIVDHHGSPVAIRSLYEAQVDDRDRFANASFREYHLGDYDLFEHDGPGGVDSAYIDPQWQQEVTAFADLFGLGITGFDDASNTGFVPFSFAFDVDPGDQVVAATLSIALRGLNTSPSLELLAIESVASSVPLSSLGIGSPLTSDSSSILVLPLAPESMSDLQDGLLNIMIGNGLSVDWARLELVVVPGLAGDVNRDGLLDAMDIDLLTAAIRSESADKSLDLDENEVVGGEDLGVLLSLMGVLPGDADLSGTVDLLDLSRLAANFQGVGGWAMGNFNSDDRVDLLDLSTLASYFKKSYGDTIPEPAGIWPAMAAMYLGWLRRRGRSCAPARGRSAHG